MNLLPSKDAWQSPSYKFQLSGQGGSKGERLRGSRFLEALRTHLEWLTSCMVAQGWVCLPGLVTRVCLRELGVILGSLGRVWELRWVAGNLMLFMLRYRVSGCLPFSLTIGRALVEEKTLFSLDCQCSLEDILQFLNDIKAFQKMSKNQRVKVGAAGVLALLVNWSNVKGTPRNGRFRDSKTSQSNSNPWRPKFQVLRRYPKSVSAF